MTYADVGDYETALRYYEQELSHCHGNHQEVQEYFYHIVGKVWQIENLANRLQFTKLKPSKLVVIINIPLADLFIRQTNP